MESCLFCGMVAGDIPCDKVYEDDSYLAFRDINPQAPVHLLIIPKRHLASVADLDPADAGVIGDLAVIGSRLAAEAGLNPGGFRWVFNCGDDGGQTVPHIHLHLLGGRRLGWPPG